MQMLPLFDSSEVGLFVAMLCREPQTLEESVRLNMFFENTYIYIFNFKIIQRLKLVFEIQKLPYFMKQNRQTIESTQKLQELPRLIIFFIENDQ